MLFDFKATIPKVSYSQYPWMNEPLQPATSMITRPVVTYDNLDYWIERTPEAIAILNAIVTDIKSDGFRFEGHKVNIEKAKHFVKTNFFAEEYYTFLWDWIKYGDAYMWIGGVGKALEIQDKLQRLNIEIDEDFPRLIKTIPANTIDILHDGKRITNFRQNVTIQASNPILYSVKDVVHGKLLPNKGKVYGFSPSQASLTEMNVIGYLKDYAGTFFKNGGTPDWMFSLPNEMAGSPNHKRLIEMLQKYKHPVNKHGNLVFAGEVVPTQIGTGLEHIDITFLGIYFTSVLALAHNMPVSRVAAIIGAKVKVSSGGDDLANEGYWSKIAEHQDRLETWFNTQLWEPYFKVTMKTNRAWKTNEIKEQQRNQFAINNVMTINKELSMRYSKQLKLETLQRYLYLDDNDLEEGKIIEEMKMAGTPLQEDNLANKRGLATESFREQKRKQIPQDQEMGLKGKITHEINKELFFEKIENFVKGSITRNLYYNIKNGVFNGLISLPDEAFKLTISVFLLSQVELDDIKQFGELTEGAIL